MNPEMLIISRQERALDGLLKLLMYVLEKHTDILRGVDFKKQAMLGRELEEVTMSALLSSYFSLLWDKKTGGFTSGASWTGSSRCAGRCWSMLLQPDLQKKHLSASVMCWWCLVMVIAGEAWGLAGGGG